MSISVRRRIAALIALVFLFAMVVPVSGFAGVGGQYVHSPDDYEPLDDDPTTAPILDEWSYHNFHDDDDEDWSIISVDTTGQAFLLETLGLDGRTFDSEIHVWTMDGDGNEDTDIANNDDSGFWADTYSSTLYWTAPAPGDYLVQVVQNDPGETGGYLLFQGYGSTKRIDGATRFDTAAFVSNHIWSQTTMPEDYDPNGPDTIVVANGMDFADALAGANFAMQMDGVLLLTRAGALPSATKAEIDRLTHSVAAKVYVLGGTGAVSASTMAALGDIEGVNYLERVSGADRYETAAAIATELDDEDGVGTTAFIVSGMAWADGLAAGPVAAFNDSALLMSRTTAVPTVTMDWLADNGITDVVLVGGTGVLSAAVETELTTAGYTVERIAGANRYETAQKVAQWGVDNAGMDGDSAIFASGADFPDGLVAGTISWWNGGPLLLTMPSAMSPEIVDFFDDNGGVDDPCYLVGGEGAVSASTYWDLQDLWMP